MPLRKRDEDPCAQESKPSKLQIPEAQQDKTGHIYIRIYNAEGQASNHPELRWLAGMEIRKDVNDIQY